MPCGIALRENLSLCLTCSLQVIIHFSPSFLWGAMDNINMTNGDYIIIENTHTHMRIHNTMVPHKCVVLTFFLLCAFRTTWIVRSDKQTGQLNFRVYITWIVAPWSGNAKRLTSILVSTTAIWRPTFREQITMPTNHMNSVRNQFQPRKGVI